MLNELIEERKTLLVGIYRNNRRAKLKLGPKDSLKKAGKAA